ncbi:MAG: hypothetical protein ACRDHZ_00730 [Ktedonobacteraceae bacterium]
MRSNTVAKRDLTRGAVQARRMIAASQGPAKFILDSTVEIADAPALITRHADRAVVVCRVLIQANETYHLVESSKFTHRYYVVIERNNVWQCSSREETIAQACIAKVQTFVQETGLKAQLAQAQAAFWTAESKVSRARTPESLAAWAAKRETARAEHHRLLAEYAAWAWAA